MSVLRSVFGAEHRTASVPSLEQLLTELRGGATWAGPVVSEESAMRLMAVWSSVNLLADLVSTMPVDQYRQIDKTHSEQVDLAPVIASPSSIVDPIAWRRQAMVSALLRGNVYGIQTATGSNGWPLTIEIAHPDWIGAHQSRRFAPVEWKLNGKKLDSADMWHLPSHTIPGTPIGLSPISYMRQSVGLGLGVQEYGARWFGDGAHPSSVLSSDQKIDEPTAKLMKQRFVDAVRGKREPAVLGAGVKYDQIQVAPNESQFLETIKANRSEIAGIFFPHLILSEGASMTYSNVEARALDLLVYDMQPWMVRLEKWMSRMIPRAQFVKLNADALVRTTLKDRYEAHAIGIVGGFLCPDEARDLEDRPPIPDGKGKQFLWPPAKAGAPPTPPTPGATP